MLSKRIKSINLKISKADTSISQLKDKLSAAEAELESLIAEKSKIEQEEIIIAALKSGKTFEDIMKYLTGETAIVGSSNQSDSHPAGSSAESSDWG